MFVPFYSNRRLPIKKAPAILEIRLLRTNQLGLSVLPPEFGKTPHSLLRCHGRTRCRLRTFRFPESFPCTALRLPFSAPPENLHQPFSLCQSQPQNTLPLPCISHISYYIGFPPVCQGADRIIFMQKLYNMHAFSRTLRNFPQNCLFSSVKMLKELWKVLVQQRQNHDSTCPSVSSAAG